MTDSNFIDLLSYHTSKFLCFSLESITDIQTTYAVIDLYMSEEWNTGERDPKGTKVKLSGPGSDGYAWTTDTYFLLAKRVKYYPESQNFIMDNHGNVHRG